MLCCNAWWFTCRYWGVLMVNATSWAWCPLLFSVSCTVIVENDTCLVLWNGDDWIFICCSRFDSIWKGGQVEIGAAKHRWEIVETKRALTYLDMWIAGSCKQSSCGATSRTLRMWCLIFEINNIRFWDCDLRMMLMMATGKLCWEEGLGCWP